MILKIMGRGFLQCAASAIGPRFYTIFRGFYTIFRGFYTIFRGFYTIFRGISALPLRLQYRLLTS